MKFGEQFGVPIVVSLEEEENPLEKKEKCYNQYLWDKYYSEYIQRNQGTGKDLFQLTNEAIQYCVNKLGLKEET